MHASRPLADLTNRRRLLRERRGAYAALVPLFVLFILWLWLFYNEGAYRGGPGGRAFGADFAMFVTAGKLLGEGRDPYDHALLYRTERALMTHQHLPVTKRRDVVRVGNPPLFLWALSPVSRMPFQAVALVWMLALYALSLAGFLALLRYFEWQARLVPSLVFILMPPVVLGAFYGNVTGLVFAALSAALVLLESAPIAAGCLLTLAWVKPPVALPAVLLMLLFQTAHWRRAAISFTGTTAGLALLNVLILGPQSLSRWVSGLTGYSRDMNIQPDVASLAGFYTLWAPHAVRLILAGLLAAAALAFTVVAWRRLPHRRPLFLGASAYLWFVWFLAAPYAHIFDLVLLAVPLLGMMGIAGRAWRRPGNVATLYLLFVAVLLIDATPFGVFLLPIPVLAIAVIAYLRRHEDGDPGATRLTLTSP